MPQTKNYDQTDIRTDTSDIKLLPGETIIQAIPIDRPIPERPASALDELRYLTHLVDTEPTAEIKGPSFASKSLKITEKLAQLHLYETLFGRDSIRVALDLLDQYPRLMHATLLRLAELQGTETYIRREEEPGKIIHEYRNPKEDPFARKLTQDRGWEWPYYGSVDATPQFIQAFYAYISRNPVRVDLAFLDVTYTGRDNRRHTMREALDSAVGWLIHRLNSNPEGLLEFKPAFKGSAQNQAWKDSPDSYHHASGQFANHKQGIASIEVQRVAYDALVHASQLYDLLENQSLTKQLMGLAENLRKQTLDKFWTDEKGGYFVLGTDRDQNGRLRQLKVRTSNMGHLLHSSAGFLIGYDPDTVHRREAIIKQLFSPDMLNVGGIRTLAQDEVRFRPGAYHNGSVWPMDTNYISEGLRRHNYTALADELDKRILDIITTTNQFPEYVRGGTETTPTLNTRIVDVWDEQNHFINRIEQPPQEVQAWTVAAILPIRRRQGANHTPKKPSKFEQKILANLL